MKYLCSKGFQACADHIVDPATALDPLNVKKNDIIYVEACVLYYFFDHYYAKISNPFILVSHGSDLSVPGKYVYALNDDKLVAWFAQNIDFPLHPKLFHIPIGLNIDQDEDRFIAFENALITSKTKHFLLYANFTVGTNPRPRKESLDFVSKLPFCYVSSYKPFDEYLIDLVNSKFVISPPGGGLDCYRTWEALYMGAIPIVKSNSLNPLYTGLPVVIVNEWSEINENFLNEKWRQMENQSFNLEKLRIDYWLNLISSCRSH